MNLPALPRDDTGDALRRLAADRSDLSQPMTIDFHVAVPHQQAAEALAARCRQLSFEVDISQDEETADWTCTCSRRMVPGHAEITAIEQQLDALARPLGGHIDGWGSYGNAPPAAKRPWWQFW